jgi:tetratricopeptide (TPR) repeat protein
MKRGAEQYGAIQSLGQPARVVLISLLLLFLVIPAALSQAYSTLQQQVESHTHLAQQYLSEGKPELAIPELQAVVVLDPKNVVARGNLGVLIFFQGDYANAVPQLRAALSLQPDLWKIQALLGISEMRIHQDSAGRSDLAAAFPRLPEDKFKIDAGNDLITNYSSTGDLDKAAAIISVMLTVHPEDPKLLYTAFRLYSDLASQTMLTMAMTASSSEEMSLATEHELAMHLMAQQVAMHPDSAAGVAQLRQSLAANRQLLSLDADKSLSIASDLLKLHPMDTKSLLATYRLYSDLVDQTLLRLATSSPNTAFMYQAIAHILAKQGYSTAAIASYHQAIKLNPNSPYLHFELGEMLYTSSSPALQAQAEAEYKAALAAGPDTEKAKLRLGEIAAKRSDLEAAYAAYSRVLDHQPDNAEAAMDMASLLKEMGQPAKALPLMERSVRLDPTNASSHYRLSLLYRDAGRLEDAKREIAEYKKVQELEGQSRRTLAWVACESKSSSDG